MIAVQGQIFSQSQQPMHLGWSIIQVLPISGSSGPGTVSMQSTGQTATQTSQPVQLSGLMSALGRPFLGAGGAAAAIRYAAAACLSRWATSWLTILQSAEPAAFCITNFMICPWFTPTVFTASSTSCLSASGDNCCGR